MKSISTISFSPIQQSHNMKLWTALKFSAVDSNHLEEKIFLF